MGIEQNEQGAGGRGQGGWNQWDLEVTEGVGGGGGGGRGAGAGRGVTIAWGVKTKPVGSTQLTKMFLNLHIAARPSIHGCRWLLPQRHRLSAPS